MNDTDNTNYTITTQPISQIETDRLLEMAQEIRDWAWYCAELEKQNAEKDDRISVQEEKIKDLIDRVMALQEAATEGEEE